MSMITHDITSKTLGAKYEAIQDDIPRHILLRIHRSLRWLGRSEVEPRDKKDAGFGDGLDARFIFLWIAFNAVYADLKDAESDTVERWRHRKYFDELVKHDKDRRIYDALWEKFPGPIRQLMDNRYVFAPYWHYRNGREEHSDWKEKMSGELKRFLREFGKEETSNVLRRVFDRLYVLRNQLIHGGATWNSSKNRSQVKDGTAILGFLVPIFIDIMIDNPDGDWGVQPHYPPIDE